MISTVFRILTPKYCTVSIFQFSPSQIPFRHFLEHRAIQGYPGHHGARVRNTPETCDQFCTQMLKDMNGNLQKPVHPWKLFAMKQHTEHLLYCQVYFYSFLRKALFDCINLPPPTKKKSMHFPPSVNCNTLVRVSARFRRGSRGFTHHWGRGNLRRKCAFVSCFCLNVCLFLFDVCVHFWKSEHRESCRLN